MSVDPFSRLDKTKFPKVKAHRTAFDLEGVREKYPDHEFFWAPYSEDGESDAAQAFALQQAGFSMVTYRDIPELMGKYGIKKPLIKGKPDPLVDDSVVKYFGQILYWKLKKECEADYRERLNRVDARLDRLDSVRNQEIPNYTF